MGNQYHHLDHTERTLIYWWLKEKVSIREMARRLHRSHSSISRELRRNLWFANKDYSPRGAQIIYTYRLQKRARRYRLKSEKVRRYVHKKLHSGWTPELIAGRLKNQGDIPYACKESIYQYIYCLATDLIKYLPRKHKKRRIKHPYRKTAERIKHRKSLSLRPLKATERLECGHWESDTIVAGDRKHGLNVLVDRKSRLTHISLLKNKTAEMTRKLITQRLKSHPESLRQSITYDNGSENTLHESINKTLGTDSYFCEPYHSWEKGSVEQVNGLIRRYLPKGTNFNTLTSGAINSIEKLLNNRPRKCLNYKTPYEVFRKERGALAI